MGLSGNVWRISWSISNSGDSAIIESNDPSRAETRNLPAEFGPDRTRRAGDQDDFAFEGAANLILFQAYRCPAQKILNCHLADLADQAVILDDLAQPWHSLAFRSRAWHSSRILVISAPVAEGWQSE